MRDWAESMRHSLTCRTWLALLALAWACGVQAQNFQRNYESYDQFNTRRIAEEVAAMSRARASAGNSTASPSQTADWSSWDRFINRHRAGAQGPVQLAPAASGGSPLERYEQQRVAAAHRQQLDAFYAALDRQRHQEFMGLVREADKGDEFSAMELGRRIATTYYYPKQVKLPAPENEVAMSYMLRGYMVDSWTLRTNLIGLIPSVLDPQRYPVSQSSAAVSVFQRGGVEDRISAAAYEDGLRTRAGRGEHFAALELAALLMFEEHSGYKLASRLTPERRQEEVRRLLEQVRRHCGYVGTFFIGAMLLEFPDRDGEYLAAIKVLLENPERLPGDTNGFYTELLRDEARRVMLFAAAKGKLANPSWQLILDLLRDGRGPMARYLRRYAGNFMWTSNLRFSMEAAAADYESYLSDAARNPPESEPVVPDVNLRARAAVMRGIARLQGDQHAWPAGEPRDARAAMAEFDRALSLFRDDPQAVQETRLRRQYAAAVAGDTAAAQALQRGAGPGLAGLLAGLVSQQGLAPQSDAQGALGALASALEREGGERVRVRDTRDALRSLVALRAALPDQGPRVAAVFDRYLAASRFPADDQQRIRADFALAASGRLPAALAQDSAGAGAAKPPAAAPAKPGAAVMAAPTPVGTGTATASTPASGVTVGRADEAQLIQFLNTLRTSGANCLGTRVPAAPPLQWDDQLAVVARALAAEKAMRKSSAAQGEAESVPLGVRLTRAGYRWSVIEELEATDKPGAIDALMSLLPDKERCTNMMSALYSRAAVAAASREGATGPAQWVLILVRPSSP